MAIHIKSFQDQEGVNDGRKEEIKKIYDRNNNRFKHRHSFHFFSILRAHIRRELRPSEETICATKLKEICSYCILYEYNEKKLPASNDWCESLKPYIKSTTPAILNPIYHCPKDKIGPCSYAMNANIPTEATDLPPDLVLLFESAPGWNQVGGPEDVVTDRHDKPGANIAFADGHVEFVKPEDIPKLRWIK